MHSKRSYLLILLIFITSAFTSRTVDAEGLFETVVVQLANAGDAEAFQSDYQLELVDSVEQFQVYVFQGNAEISTVLQTDERVVLSALESVMHGQPYFWGANPPDIEAQP
ncbi:MAG: hypothetical protein ACPG8W_15110, partial [Candidatus Promineifilaceae bacterium]